MGETQTHEAVASATGGNDGRRRRLTVRRLLGVAVLVLGGLGLVGAETPTPVAAAAPVHATLVNAVPTATTPHVTNGNVYSVAVVGNTVVLGGDFTGSTDPDGTVFNRSNILAFDKTTGRIRRDWVPQVDNEVYSVVAAADGQSVYIGGRFNRVDGVVQNKVARLSITDGRPLPFQSGVDAVVTTMALSGNRLYIGGVFKNVQGRARRFAALNAGNGAIDDNVSVAFEGTHRGGDGKIWRIEPSPDGQHVMVVGSFATVGGQPRNQIVKLDTNGGGAMTVSPWSTTSFSGYCASFTDYVRDVSYSPDGSYFVVVTTGAKGSGLNGTCDSVSRWADNETPSSTNTWIEYSGGDSYYSAEVTGAAIYVGGHFRYSNNSYGNDSLGAGGSATTGIAALDPANGLPLSWNPGRDRGRAVWQLVATQDGLYVASDTDRIAEGRYRGRIAFFPLTGGRPVPQPARLTLPLGLHQYAPSGNPTRVVRRDFDGTNLSTPAAAVADASALSGARAAFAANGILYTAHSDGTLKARSYDGTTLGAPVDVNLQRMTDFATDLRNMNGAILDNGRLYYTVSGSSTLYMRYFSVENRVVGAQRFNAATSAGGLDYRDVGGMVLAGDDVYYVNRAAGTLVRAPWRATGGIDPASRTTVSNANTGGISWTTSVLFALQGDVPNQPPTATATVSCTGLGCAFDASGSRDADGTIASYAWAFGNGQTGSGATPTYRYPNPGTYNASVTVTDNEGATAVFPLTVTVSDLPATASFTASCADATCAVDGSASSDPDGAITAYAWDFGDGTTATGATAVRTYTTSGNYTIRLTVTDARGQTATTTRPVSVTVPAGRGFVASAASTGQSSLTTHRVTVPGAVRAGDQLLLFASSNAPRGTALNAPAGWTRVLDADTNGSRNAVFSRTATAADVGSTVSVTVGVASKVDVVVSAYRGLTLGTGGATSATGYATPSATAPLGAWVVSYWADKSATTAGWTAPAGVTTRHSRAGTGAGHVSELLVDSGAGVAAGPTGAKTATPSGAPVANAVAVTIVLTP